MDGERKFTYPDMSGRCRRLSDALAGLGRGCEDRVVAPSATSHVMLELHHAMPMLGAAPVPLSTPGSRWPARHAAVPLAGER